MSSAIGPVATLLERSPPWTLTYTKEIYLFCGCGATSCGKLFSVTSTARDEAFLAASEVVSMSVPFKT